MADAARERPAFALPLSPRQLQLCGLYAHGHTLKEIAHIVGITLAGVENGLYRSKVKYRNAGHDVHTKADVRERLIADGLYEP